MSSRKVRSQRLLVVSLAVALLAVAVYSWRHLQAAQAEALAARVSMAECMGLVEDIGQLTARPRVVALQASSQTSVSEQIEAAVARVGLPTTRLRTVTAEQPQPVENTQYVNQVTRMEIEQATLRQILQLAQDLEANGTGFRLRDIVITISDRPAAGRELWDLDAVLTQTVFSPTTR